MMLALNRPWGVMNVQVDGPENGPVVVFANSLGTDLRLWDAILPLLPARLRVIRYDKRGHGLSDLGGLAEIADYADDLIALIDTVVRRPVVLVGLSIGGLIAQAVATARPDLIRALVLSNTAARLGTAESWAARIEAVEGAGLASIADAVMERWFAPAFRATPDIALWRNMLTRTDPKDYVAACRALATADQTAATARLAMPTLLIAGAADGASPPDVVKATADLIAGAAYHCIPGVGHLPCVEAPQSFAAILNPFLQEHCQ